eukprot:g14703.t1
MAEEELLAHYSTLTGAWVLDLSRSDTMRDYLQLLDTPEATIQAQAAAEQNKPGRNAIALDPATLTIYKDTAVNNYTEAFELGVEQFSEPNVGVTKRCSASLIDDDELGGYLVVTNMISPGRNLSLVDARRLQAGGHAHVQTLSVRNNTTGAHCTIRRTWVRVPMTNDDLQRLDRWLAE